MFTANLRQMRTEIQNSLDNDGDYDDDDEVGTESRQFDVVDIEPVDLSHLGTLNSTEDRDTVFEDVTLHQRLYKVSFVLHKE